ncbi:MAG: transglycosylase domain-containing protein, partial [Bacteroidota bacterium]
MSSQDITYRFLEGRLQYYYGRLDTIVKQNPWISLGVAFFAMLCLCGQILVWSVQWGAFGSLPDNRTLLFPPLEKASEIYSADGALLGRVYLKDRTLITYRSLPVHVTEALIATEDVRFYAHDGVDLRSLGRVLVRNILLGEKSAGGGSTLSQQLAKLWFPRQEFGYFSLLLNKVREMLIAEHIERLYPKDQVIVQYLNTVFLGEQAYGIEAAAYRYFGKQSEDLTVEEGATLVGMLQAPSYYNPYRHPDRARQRRDIVLAQMLKYDYLDSTSYDSLRVLPLIIDYHPPRMYEGMAPHFRAYVTQTTRQWLKAHPKPDGSHWNIFTDGLKITTSLDSRIQQHAEEAVNS